MKIHLLLLCVFSSIFFYSQSINLEEFAIGLSNPVEIAHANDNRLFVVQQNGTIKVVNANGTVNTSDFLNISSKVIFSGEQGLLGLAFHPQYATNKYFFVYYNAVGSGNITVARYTTSSTNPDVADPTSEKIILNIPKPFTNHNGGSLHFAPDGNLWISTGDGGGGGDPNNNAQNKNSLLGKILRIDINSSNAYNIPAGNPFAAGGGAPEVWSYGLRNAWKFSFDTTAENVWIADVGQNLIEEINRNPITQSAINYGWRCYEGNDVYNGTGCAAASTMVFPVAVYNHSNGRCSITGGYVYRGNTYPSLQGKYLFTDYCTPQMGLVNADNSITWSTTFLGNNFASFGEDFQKEVYVISRSAGKIFKITSSTLGTQELNVQKIKMHPQSSTKTLFVQGLGNEEYEVEFLNMEGRISLNTTIKNKQADISLLNKGIYFATISKKGERIYSQKVVVE